MNMSWKDFHCRMSPLNLGKPNFGKLTVDLWDAWVVSDSLCCCSRVWVCSCVWRWMVSNSFIWLCISLTTESSSDLLVLDSGEVWQSAADFSWDIRNLSFLITLIVSNWKSRLSSASCLQAASSELSRAEESTQFDKSSQTSSNATTSDSKDAHVSLSFSAVADEGAPDNNALPSSRHC